nr:hypothetical protein BaRGS_002884 [Batillaria attramentaria]
MEDNEDGATEDPDIFQHLSEAYLQHPIARGDPKRRAMGASGELAKQILRRKWGWIGHTLRKPSLDMEPAGEKEERPASQQLEAGH